jgi:hypothetical protein
MYMHTYVCITCMCMYVNSICIEIGIHDLFLETRYVGGQMHTNIQMHTCVHAHTQITSFWCTMLHDTKPMSGTSGAYSALPSPMRRITPASVPPDHVRMHIFGCVHIYIYICMYV